MFFLLSSASEKNVTQVSQLIGCGIHGLVSVKKFKTYLKTDLSNTLETQLSNDTGQ